MNESSESRLRTSFASRVPQHSPFFLPFLLYRNGDFNWVSKDFIAFASPQGGSLRRSLASSASPVELTVPPSSFSFSTQTTTTSELSPTPRRHQTSRTRNTLKLTTTSSTTSPRTRSSSLFDSTTLSTTRGTSRREVSSSRTCSSRTERM